MQKLVTSQSSHLTHSLSLHIFRVFAVRLSGLHFCRPPLTLSTIFPVVKLMLTSRLRKRIRIHSGSDASVKKELDKYGLHASVIPTEIGGELVLDNKKWLTQRRSEGK